MLLARYYHNTLCHLCALCTCGAGTECIPYSVHWIHTYVYISQEDHHDHPPIPSTLSYWSHYGVLVLPDSPQANIADERTTALCFVRSTLTHTQQCSTYIWRVLLISGTGKVTNYLLRSQRPLLVRPEYSRLLINK